MGVQDFSIEKFLKEWIKEANRNIDDELTDLKEIRKKSVDLEQRSRTFKNQESKKQRDEERKNKESEDPNYVAKKYGKGVSKEGVDSKELEGLDEDELKAEYKQLKQELIGHEQMSIKIEDKIAKIKSLLPSETSDDGSKTLSIEIITLYHKMNKLKSELSKCNG